MRRLFTRLWKLVTELQRRRVYRVAAIYGLTLFVLLQIADATFEPLGIPAAGVAILVVVGVAGFPVAVVLAWLFDFDEEGIRRAESGAVAGVFGRTPARKATTLVLTAAVSVAMAWGGWTAWRTATGHEAPASPERTTFDPRRIAVLYLDDYSDDGSLAYLSGALTEGLVHELSRVEGLRVASRNAVNAYRNTDLPLDSIVQALEVGSLVEGSLSRSGDRIRVTVQLVDGATLDHLDSQVIEGSLDDPFAFQDSLTLHVTRALRRRLGQAIQFRTARAETEDAEAWTMFARGREALESSTGLEDDAVDAAVRAVARADSLFALAEAADPEWLAPTLNRGHAAIRMADIQAPLPGASDTTWASRADSILGEVLRRDPRSAEALEARGQLRLQLARTPGVTDPAGLLQRAESDLRAALDLDEDLPGAWWTLSRVLVRQGRFSEGVDAAEAALEADVFLRQEEDNLWSLTNAVLQVGPEDEGIRLCNEGRRRFPANANFIWCRFVLLGGFPQVAPDPDHAAALLDSLSEAVPAESLETWMTYGRIWLARVMARAGMADSARVLLAGVREPGDTPPALAYDEAYVQLLLGDEAEAVRLLDLSLTEDIPDTVYARNDWWLRDLHDYEPFRVLVGLDQDAR